MEDIKRKILGLMAKTTENGCSEDEAMNASAKVQEMLNKYQLSLSDIKIKESKCTTGLYDTRLNAHAAVYHCVTAIAKFTDTKCWIANHGGEHGHIAYAYFGLEHDVMIAEYVTKICDWAIIYGGEDFKSSSIYGDAPKGHRHKVLSDFRYAMACRIAKRLRDMKAAQEAVNASDGRSLVVVKGAVVTEEFAKLNMNLKGGRKGTVNITSAAAYEAGTVAGDKVSINPGLKGQNHDYKAVSSA